MDEGGILQGAYLNCGEGGTQSSFTSRWHMCQQMSMIVKIMDMLGIGEVTIMSLIALM